MPTDLIKARGRTLNSDLDKRINSIQGKKEFPQQWKESVTVAIYKKAGKTD